MKLQNVASPFKKLGRQFGSSLLEVIGAVAIGALILVGVADQTNRYIDNTKDAYTAEHARLYAAAARAYVKANPTSIISATPVSVTASDIVEYLPVGFATDPRNPYGQIPRILLRKGVSGVEGYLIYDGGDGIPEGRRQFVSVMAGIGGGFVDDAGIPQGAGWSDGKYDETFGQVLSATAGRVVVSLNLLNPSDPQDCRYLSINNPTAPGCGDKLKRDLDMGIYGIRVTSLTDVAQIAAGPTQIVSILGGLSATLGIAGETLAPMLRVARGSSCEGYSLGTIAQLSATTKSPKQGTLLSCQNQPASDGGTKSWRTVIATGEERSAVVGCWGNEAELVGGTSDTFLTVPGNDYCKKSPVDYCADFEKYKLQGAEAQVGKVSQTWPRYTYPCGVNTSNTLIVDRPAGQGEWEAELGEKPFCALSMHAQGPSTLSATVTSNSSGVSYTESPVPSGKRRTYCRVYTKPVAVPGIATSVTKWFIKAGSQDNMAVACHASCLDSN